MEFPIYSSHRLRRRNEYPKTSFCFGLDRSSVTLMDLLPMRIAGWLEVRAHEIRKIATSLLFMRRCTVYQVLKASTWLCQSTFSTFCL